MEKIRLKNRLWNKFYAFVHGYFWIRCPLCGKKFGGHEPCGDLMISQSSGVGVCIECCEEAKRRNDKFMKSDECKRQLEQAYGPGARFR